MTSSKEIEGDNEEALCLNRALGILPTEKEETQNRHNDFVKNLIKDLLCDYEQCLNELQVIITGSKPAERPLLAYAYAKKNNIPYEVVRDTLEALISDK